jgi:EAL domain-containing protein (putative c-di-GMP-specific phosphodiesterase class I)
LILAMGEWVLRSACDQILLWQSRGLPPVPVMVNLSLIQTRTDDLIAMVVDLMERTGLSPGCLGIEVTENTACLNMDQVVGLLRRLRRLGVKIIMDDFGSGYSSLSRLKRFPVDSVKIDKAFISGIPDDHDDVAILRAIIALAKTLNLEVVAEGVENERQAELLRRFDCDAAQGFFFARPLPAAEFESLFGDPRRLSGGGTQAIIGPHCRSEPGPH